MKKNITYLKYDLDILLTWLNSSNYINHIINLLEVSVRIVCWILLDFIFKYIKNVTLPSTFKKKFI